MSGEGEQHKDPKLHPSAPTGILRLPAAPTSLWELKREACFLGTQPPPPQWSSGRQEKREKPSGSEVRRGRR